MPLSLLLGLLPSRNFHALRWTCPTQASIGSLDNGSFPLRTSHFVVDENLIGPHKNEYTSLWPVLRFLDRYIDLQILQSASFTWYRDFGDDLDLASLLTTLSLAPKLAKLALKIDRDAQEVEHIAFGATKATKRRIFPTLQSLDLDVTYHPALSHIAAPVLVTMSAVISRDTDSLLFVDAVLNTSFPNLRLLNAVSDRGAPFDFVPLQDACNRVGVDLRIDHVTLDLCKLTRLRESLASVKLLYCASQGPIVQSQEISLPKVTELVVEPQWSREGYVGEDTNLDLPSLLQHLSAVNLLSLSIHNCPLYDTISWLPDLLRSRKWSEIEELDIMLKSVKRSAATRQTEEKAVAALKRACAREGLRVSVWCLQDTSVLQS